MKPLRCRRLAVCRSTCWSVRRENHVPLNQRQRWEQVSILENYLMRAVMNLQTLERAQVSPLHSFKETAQADRRYLPPSWKKPSGYLG